VRVVPPTGGKKFVPPALCLNVWVDDRWCGVVWRGPNGGAATLHALPADLTIPKHKGPLRACLHSDDPASEAEKIVRENLDLFPPINYNEINDRREQHSDTQ
jgi:hypothetical protein